MRVEGLALMLTLFLIGCAVLVLLTPTWRGK
jgi:hypothetical protein